MLPKKWNAEVIEFRGHYDRSVDMIIVQFKDYLRQKSEVKISIRPFREKFLFLLTFWLYFFLEIFKNKSIIKCLKIHFKADFYPFYTVLAQNHYKYGIKK